MVRTSARRGFPPRRKVLLDAVHAEAVRVSLDGRTVAEVHLVCGSLPTRWHVVRTYPFQERRAATELRQQGFLVYLPVDIVEIRRTPAFRPAIYGYLFVGFDPADAQWRPILSTRGVIDVMLVGGRPAAVRRGEVERVMKWQEERLGNLMKGLERPRQAARPKVEVGNVGVVEDGPFTSFTATVTEAEPGERLVVTVSVFGRETPIHLAPAHFRRTGGVAAPQQCGPGA